MRIGTWNLDARWSPAHASVLLAADCDVWLLTELSPAAVLPGYAGSATHARMTRGQHYAVVLSRREVCTVPDPHPASAAVVVHGVTFCSSVLPWAAKDDPAVWGSGAQGERTAAAVAMLSSALPPRATVWGGDFNHALAGPTRHAGSRAGRAAIRAGLATLALSAPTAPLPHRIAGICTIDQICVPADWTVVAADRIPQPKLSDHDLYVVETESVRSIS